MAQEPAPLDAAFVSGIKEELGSIEENEKNIQALSQVFRYYATRGHARQLAGVLGDFALKQCFPWELIHALHLIDDILLMDNTGRYRLELKDRVRAIAVHAFCKMQSEQEKRELAKMLHAWRALRIFEEVVLEEIAVKIRNGAPAAAHLLDEAAAADDDDDDDEPEPPITTGPASAAQQENAPAAAPAPYPAANGATASEAFDAASAKRLRVERKATKEPIVQKATVSKEAVRTKCVAMLDRILSIAIERPFDMLGIQAGSDGQEIRKAYRRLALIIHPDKNPGLESRCQEAMARLQQGREHAESGAPKSDGDKAPPDETRSTARCEKANAAFDTGFKCKYPDCDQPPCKQCANGCCTRNITHCHFIARSKGGAVQCYFHPPPRAWARNATAD